MDLIKIFLPTVLSFCIGMALTPYLLTFLHRHKMWKKKSVSMATDGGTATLTNSLHNDEERKTPRMGGIIIWASVFVTTFLLALLGLIFPETVFEKLSFLSRNQTWLPLFTLIAGGMFGLIDDYLVCNDRGSYKGGGLSLRARLAFVMALGALGAWWFYAKLGMASIYIPFVGDFYVGFFFIPLFIFTMIAMYSGGVIDGVDGLSGGVFATIFGAYAVIAFTAGQVDIAAFTMVVIGGILAFLWSNIPPAKFFNSETGTMALTTCITVIAFLTNAVAVLPLIAFLPLLSAASSLIQIASKKLRGGKKVFLVAPIHNHFQLKGWSPYQVTMRYWILSIMCAVVGTIIVLVG